MVATKQPMKPVQVVAYTTLSPGGVAAMAPFSDIGVGGGPLMDCPTAAVPRTQVGTKNASGGSSQRTNCTARTTRVAQRSASSTGSVDA